MWMQTYTDESNRSNLAFLIPTLFSWYHIMQVSSWLCTYPEINLTAKLNIISQITLPFSNAVYFGGVSEFSSIFLAISTLFQYHPPSALVPADSPKLPLLNAVELFCQAMFVLTFFIFRIVGWVHTCYKFLIDCRYVIHNKLVDRYQPGSGWFLWYLITISLLLSMLQIFWFWQIVEKIKSML